MYTGIKHSHLLFISLSFIFFFIRGSGMILNTDWYKKQWLNLTTYIIDSLLLVTGIVLAILSQQYPFIYGWLTVKLIAVILYILLGSIALSYGKTKTIRTLSWFTALIIFGYIIMVAIKKDYFLGLV